MSKLCHCLSRYLKQNKGKDFTTGETTIEIIGTNQLNINAS